MASRDGCLLRVQPRVSSRTRLLAMCHRRPRFPLPLDQVVFDLRVADARIHIRQAPSLPRRPPPHPSNSRLFRLRGHLSRRGREIQRQKLHIRRPTARGAKFRRHVLGRGEFGRYLARAYRRRVCGITNTDTQKSNGNLQFNRCIGRQPATAPEQGGVRADLRRWHRRAIQELPHRGTAVPEGKEGFRKTSVDGGRGHRTRVFIRELFCPISIKTRATGVIVEEASGIADIILGKMVPTDTTR